MTGRIRVQDIVRASGREDLCTECEDLGWGINVRRG